MKLAFLGTGLMGFPMARRLLDFGHEVTVYNRTRSRAEALAEYGAAIADTPDLAIRGSDGVILMLASGPAIRDVLFPNGTLNECRGRMVIQMGTILPEESLTFQTRIRSVAGQYMEAPVLGSTPQAAAGELFVLAGATELQFQNWRQVLECFGPEPRLIGPVGHASTLKLALNQLIAAEAAAFSLSLGMILRRGIDLESFMGILRQSPLYAPNFDKKLDRMVRRDFTEPHFPVKHLLKDIDLVRQEAEHLGLNATGVDALRRIVSQALDQGMADMDYSALYEAINPPTG